MSPVEQGALLELFPIKLVGGFIAVDQMVGCAGCSFCLSRRHALWRAVFEAGARIGGAFESPGHALGLLNRMAPFASARVPIRFGHNTDARFQWDFGRGLYNLLPPDQPFIVMTRFPLRAEDSAFFRGQSNLLLKLTVTPSSPSLAVTTDTETLLASARLAHPSNVFYLIGPLVADNAAGAAKIAESLPAGSWVEFKPLTSEGIPGLDRVTELPLRELERLRERARRRGLVVTDFFGCRIRRRLGRTFYRVDAAPEHIRRTCRDCPSEALCYGPVSLRAVEKRTRAAAGAIGLELGACEHGGPLTLRFETATPASRGDETYLSELTGVRVLLSTVPAGSQGGSFCLDAPAVLERWERVGMFPSAAVAALGERLRDELGRHLPESL